MSDDTAKVKEFAKLLAAADKEERERLMKRAELIAVNLMSDEQVEAESQPQIRTLEEYLAWDIPVPPILVEPALVVRGGLTCTVGRAGKGKTQVNLNRIMRWSCGEPLFDGLTNKQGDTILGPSGPLRILVVENEGAAGMFHRQVGIMVNAEGYIPDEKRATVKENVLVWGDGGWSGLKLDDQEKLGELRRGIEKHKPDIVFVEPFRGLWSGDENSATDMAVVADALSGIASDYDCGVILTHHERKTGAGEDGEKMSAGRGSTVLEGVVATMENFEIAKGGDFRELSWSKVRYGGGHVLLPIRMEWQAGDWWYRHVPLDEIEQSILNALADSDPDPMTVKDLCEELGEREHTIRRTLKPMVSGDVPKVKKAKSSQPGTHYRLCTPTEDSPDNLEF